MRSADAVLNELVLHVQPPLGCAAQLSERPSTGPGDPNWVATAGIMDAERTLRFSGKVAELRKSDTEINWSNVKISTSAGRVALYFSEATPPKAM
jgi:hypothetical protein